MRRNLSSRHQQAIHVLVETDLIPIRLDVETKRRLHRPDTLIALSFRGLLFYHYLRVSDLVAIFWRRAALLLFEVSRYAYAWIQVAHSPLLSD